MNKLTLLFAVVLLCSFTPSTLSSYSESAQPKMVYIETPKVVVTAIDLTKIIDYSKYVETNTKDAPEIKPDKLVPQWVLEGIIGRETKSYYSKNGNIVWVDRRRGKAGERGPFQMTPIAFRQVEKNFRKFSKLEKDLVYSETMAIKYLLYLYNEHANRDWETAIGMYNTGPSNYFRLRRIAKMYYNGVVHYAYN